MDARGDISLGYCYFFSLVGSMKAYGGGKWRVFLQLTGLSWGQTQGLLTGKWGAITGPRYGKSHI